LPLNVKKNTHNPAGTTLAPKQVPAQLTRAIQSSNISYEPVVHGMQHWAHAATHELANANNLHRHRAWPESASKLHMNTGFNVPMPHMETTHGNVLTAYFDRL
jgi:hypothetical protein